MQSKFKAVVNDSFEFSLLRKDTEMLDIVSKNNESHIVVNHNSIIAKITEADFNKRCYTVQINGNSYTVKIENELDALIAEMGLSLGEDTVTNEIHAPMPGLILEVSVSEGQKVNQGDTLCVLEAMKMENALVSPRDGVIKSLKITTGGTVDKGDLLIEFEV
ncbi:biotin/lipoyl-containing protein [Ulvibacter antarcticus]|uniref:Biotin carboxyl carrier protein n=1 Tax=Ulvibacter antarcticus TaxID=442714 RepID=A0A3L9YYB8_9FLAO|nr:biotin/lipoyl-containing protein [Ulvibacter antarcticus]RMA64830.1 biotin carboxyl carrier protein [Ulvibacter antarcticus]